MSKQARILFGILAAAVGVPSCGGGEGGGGDGACSTASQDRPQDAARVAEWEVVKAKGMSELQLAPGWWGAERVAGAVNTLGWEDSAYISADGRTLYFWYVPVDLLSWVTSQGGDAAFPTYERGPSRGLSYPPYAFPSWSSSESAGAFCVPSLFPYHVGASNLAGMQRSSEGNWYYMSDQAKSRDLYKDGGVLPAPVNTTATEDNPHFIETPAFGRELFFESGDRQGGVGKEDLWMSDETAAGWTSPVLLATPINTADFKEMQPHLTAAGKLFFASDRDGLLSLWVSSRLGKNSWSAPAKVVWPGIGLPGGSVAALGEPTLTADGQWLYFVIVFVRVVGAAVEFDSDIARLRVGPIP